MLANEHDSSPRTPLNSSNFPNVASYARAAAIRGAGVVVEVQGVAVGHGAGVGEADGLDVGVAEDDEGLAPTAVVVGDSDGDCGAAVSCAAGGPGPRVAHAAVPADKTRSPTAHPVRRPSHPIKVLWGCNVLGPVRLQQSPRSEN